MHRTSGYFVEACGRQDMSYVLLSCVRCVSSLFCNDSGGFVWSGSGDGAGVARIGNN